MLKIPLTKGYTTYVSDEDVKKLKRPWYTYINKNGTRKFLGYYSTESGAATAYNIEAVKLFGEFAKLNEIII